jgi:hypothetical protein
MNTATLISEGLQSAACNRVQAALHPRASGQENETCGLLRAMYAAAATVQNRLCRHMEHPRDSALTPSRPCHTPRFRVENT